MKLLINKHKKRKQRKLRSKLVKGDGMRPRLVLSKSNRYLTAQLIDDEKAHTLIYLNTGALEENSNSAGRKNSSRCRKNKEWSKKLGQAMVDELKKKTTVKKIAFDRNGYPYHGKIKVFCDTLRKGGINF